MSTSNVKRVQNEMMNLEQISGKLISPHLYYVVHIVFDTAILVENAHTVLMDTNRPLACYVHNKTMSLIYSCANEDEEHFLNGCHHKLISYYFNIELFDRPTNISIVELNTRTQVFTYMSWLIFKTSRAALQNSSECVTRRDIINCTATELIERLKDAGVDWDTLDPHVRYGTFIKLERQGSKVVVSSMTEEFDARNSKKYITFFFN